MYAYVYVFFIVVFKNQAEKESHSWKGTSFVLYSPRFKSKLFNNRQTLNKSFVNYKQFLTTLGYCEE